MSIFGNYWRNCLAGVLALLFLSGCMSEGSKAQAERLRKYCKHIGVNNQAVCRFPEATCYGTYWAATEFEVQNCEPPQK